MDLPRPVPRRGLNQYFLRMQSEAELAAERALISFTVEDILHNLMEAELDRAILEVMTQTADEEMAIEQEVDDSQLYYSDEETNNNWAPPPPASAALVISTETYQEELSESATTPSPSMRRCG